MSEQYWIFAWKDKPNGGMKDIVAEFAHVDSAKAMFDSLVTNQQYKEYHIFDSWSHKIVD